MPVTPEQYQAMLARLDKNPVREREEKPPDAVEVESDLQEQVIDDCRRRGWFPLFSRMDRKTTTPLGTPDLIVFADAGRVFIFEAKSRTGKLRPEQLGIQVLLEHLGHRVHIIRTFKEYLSALT